MPKEAWSTIVGVIAAGTLSPGNDSGSLATLLLPRQAIIWKAARKELKPCSYTPHHNRSYQGAIALIMPTQSQFEPIVCVVGFHHARYFNPWDHTLPLGSANATEKRGPEVETWIGVEDGSDPASENEWPLLPFMAISDGAHS